MKFNEEYLFLKNTNMLRGFCAFLILLHHLFQGIDAGTIGNLIFEAFGVFIPAIFFFYSGFGLMVSYLKKEEYLKYFLRNKVLVLVIEYLIAFLIYCIENRCWGNDISVTRILTDLKNGDTIVLFSWYILATLFFYLAFYLSFCLTKNEAIGIVVLTAFLFLYLMLIYQLKYGDWWYVSCPAFVLGVVWGWKQKKFESILNARYWISFGVAVFFFGLISILQRKYGIGVFDMVLKILRSLLFVTCFLMVTRVIPQKLGKMQALGNISLEIYMYQGLVMDLLGKVGMKQQSFVYVCVCVIVTFLFAGLMHVFNQKISSLIKAE